VWTDDRNSLCDVPRSTKGSERRSLYTSTMGGADCCRYEHGPDQMGSAAGVDSTVNAGSERSGWLGIDQPGRVDCDRRRAGVYSGGDGYLSACVRCRDRQGSVEGRAAGERSGYADDLSGQQWKAVCGDCGRWSWEAEDQARGFSGCLRAAMSRVAATELDRTPCTRPTAAL